MPEGRVTIAELLASLSRALDLVEGQPQGHCLRTAKIAVRIGQALGMESGPQSDLFYASVLKDAGCSNNSARIHFLFGGDDILFKRGSKFIDWANPVEALKYGVSNTEVGNSIGLKLLRLSKNFAPPQKVMDEVTAARCNRGAMIAMSLGFSPDVAKAISQLDEHWDGRGSPSKLKRDDISPLAQILCLSQTLEVFATTYGAGAAFTMARQRIGSWFSPEVVAAAACLEGDAQFWERQSESDTLEALRSDLPESDAMHTAADIDQVCTAYASIIDAKSTFTGEHSTRVTKYAVEVATVLGIQGERLDTLRRAALLHDIGKLGVSNQILDKPGALNDDEFSLVKLHPKHTYEILRPITGFERLSEVAAAHHERLDGKGYWRGLSSDELDLDMRCITVADVFDALTARRPYREPMPLDKVFCVLDDGIGTAFDPDCVAALKHAYSDDSRLAA